MPGWSPGADDPGIYLTPVCVAITPLGFHTDCRSVTAGHHPGCRVAVRSESSGLEKLGDLALIGRTPVGNLGWASFIYTIRWMLGAVGAGRLVPLS